jgi:hypothetical protein
MGGMMDSEQIEPVASGMSRRQVIRAGAAVGASLLWVAPVVSGFGLTAANAAAASGVTPPDGGGGGGSTPPPVTPPGNQPVDVITPVTPPLQVEGEQFTAPQQPPAKAAAPAAVLPFTGSAAPIKTATVLGAGLVVAGTAAVAATRRRQQSDLEPIEAEPAE